MESYMLDQDKPISIRSMDVTTFFNKVYMTMGLGLVATFLTSYIFYYFNFAMYLSSFAFFAIIIAQFGLVIFLSSKLQLSKVDQPQKQGLSGASATALFILYSVLTGITLSTIFYAYSDSAILITLFTTVVMFVSLSVIGRVTKKDLSGLGKFLILSLIGLILVSIINMFLGNAGLDYIISIVGVLIFSGLVVYDNNALKRMYENGFVNESNLIVFGALSLYLDFINIFIQLLSLFGNRN